MRIIWKGQPAQQFPTSLPPFCFLRSSSPSTLLADSFWYLSPCYVLNKVSSRWFWTFKDWIFSPGFPLLQTGFPSLPCPLQLPCFPAPLPNTTTSYTRHSELTCVVTMVTCAFLYILFFWELKKKTKQNLIFYLPVSLCITNSTSNTPSLT